MAPSSLSTTAATSTSLASSATPASTSVYKGKVTHRFWQQLPPEIIRHIATHYLLDVSATNYCPQTWEQREYWLPRIVYTVLRDAIDLEKLMNICPAWATALETHPFWHQACAVIDPHDSLIFHSVIRPNPPTTNSAGSAVTLQPFRLPPYRHFRNITQCSCYVCRINQPYTSAGLTASTRRPFSTPFLSNVTVCRDHRKQTFCGLCLREAPPMEIETEYNAVCCVENEDEETWPGVDATCRSCRQETLWRRVSSSQQLRDAVGGHKWNSADWETRQSVDAFIEMGEGTISEVVQLAQEKHWLRRYTKLSDMLSQALAASRYTTREESTLRGYTGSDDGSLEEEEEDEDDPELMSLTEDAGGVRDLAIGDWARSRILDGYWCSPADQWYRNTVGDLPTAVKAEHPCPWNHDATFTGAMDGEPIEDTDASGEAVHPRPCTVSGEIPPSFQLCEQAYIAYQKQMRTILLPAMKNVVRRVVIEGTADGVDPAVKAAKMTPDDIAAALRDEGVWYDGIDWLERRRNGRRDRNARERARVKEARDDVDDSSSSSKSDSSHTTSPVLSTSTLQTTPSPPPSEGKEEEVLSIRPVSFPVSPILESPVLLHPIPYIPVTVVQMPYYSMEAFKMVWREACAPLYHCKCSICARAALIANGGTLSANDTSQSAGASPATILQEIPQELVEVQLEDAPQDDGEEEVDVEVEVDTATTGEEEESTDDSDMEEVTKYGPENGEWIKRPRKRSCDDIDEDAEGESVDEDEEAGRGREKRARHHEIRKVVEGRKPLRSRKRSSEELDDTEVASGGKRMRITENGDRESSAGVSPPTSMSGTGESDSIPSAEDDEGKGNVLRRKIQTYRAKGTAPPRVVSDADLDGLYTFESEASDAGVSV